MDVPAALAPDDVLAQPTRARLFSLLGELRRPAGTVELAEALGLHPNGVRVHLERMERAGLVERARVRGQRGRPPDVWRVAAGAQPGGSAPRGYRDLG
ncbi:MAG: helix-turn-helix domain-containing protein, partial [Solirubrobacteraceae bacterium]